MADQGRKHKSEAEATPLESLGTSLAGDMQAVNAVILEKMQSGIPLINQVATYLIAAGGKRVRPLLTLSTAAALNGDLARAHGLAATVEFIHTATLLHDDVVDESRQRRGRASANARFGNEASVLVGDFLFSRAFQLMVADGSLETLRILSDASAVIAEGEVLQLQMQGNLETGWAQYIRMISAKTAALFAAACEVGAVVSGASPDVQTAAHDYGYNLGIAFQIADDLLDYTTDAVRLGKSPGDDFREGKITAPVVLAYASAGEEEREFWQRTITRRMQGREDLDTAVAALDSRGIVAEGRERAGSYARAAEENLAVFPDSEIKRDLRSLTGYVLTRQS